MSSTQAAELVGEISRRVERARAPHRPRPPGAQLAGAALAQAGLLLAQEPRPRRPALGRATATSPRPSAAIPTSSATARCCPRVGGGEAAPRAGELAELGVWTSEREREAMIIERDADDVARCFALERAALRARLRAGVRGRDHRADLRRRVRRVRHRADARMGAAAGAPRPAPFEGMLPVRAAARAAPTGAAGADRPALAPRAGARAGPARRRAATAGASGGSSTSRARSCAASAPARRCASATPSTCAWRAWTRSAGASTWCPRRDGHANAAAEPGRAEPINAPRRCQAAARSTI